MYCSTSPIHRNSHEECQWNLIAWKVIHSIVIEIVSATIVGTVVSS